MPPSREIRARQNRARERIAAAHAEHRRSLRRRQIAGGIVGAIVVIGGGIALAIALSHGGSSTAAPPAKGCVGLKDPLPKGAPAMPLTAGPQPTKLVTKDLKVGTGAVVPKNAKVTVNYVGVACSTGKIFDSSYSRNQPFAADLSGGVIPGWIQGIPGMKVGGVRLLSIPANLAYGASPPPGSGIPPEEPLFFLVSVVKLG